MLKSAVDLLWAEAKLCFPFPITQLTDIQQVQNTGDRLCHSMLQSLLPLSIRFYKTAIKWKKTDNAIQVPSFA
jgi:hypothetical protein